jgi:hypothetical protein
VDEVSKCIPVHSVSHCKRNHFGWDGQDKRGLLKKYRAVLAFENSNHEDYVTEKVYDALVAGSVPIYYGASNVQHFIPDNSAFIIKQNQSFDCSALKNLLENPEPYHAWRNPLPGSLVSDEALRPYWQVHTHCRLCHLISQWSL